MSFYACIFALIFGVFPHIITAQTFGKTVESRNVIWAGYFNVIKVSDRISINSDLQTRYNFTKNAHLQNVYRTGLHYKVLPGLELATGFGYFQDYIADNHNNNNNTIIRPELRPWQQAVLMQDGRLNLEHRFILDQRFRQKIENGGLVDEYRFNFRARYRFSLQIPINRKEMTDNTFALDIFDEILINFGSEITSRFFDQNRIFLGTSYQLNQNFRFQAGYLNIFESTNNPYNYGQNHIVRFNVYHTLNLTKKKAG